MKSERIKEIQMATAYPDSQSVQQALLQVWNECQQERMYSEEEVKKLIVDFLFVRGIGREVENVNDWFEQFKKK